MGDVGDMFLKSIPFVGGFLGDDVEAEEAEDPKTARQLKREAEKEAEKKRLARTSEKATKGKTIFSDPLVAGGMPLKENLGV
jgi:hypothetical protein